MHRDICIHRMRKPNSGHIYRRKTVKTNYHVMQHKRAHHIYDNGRGYAGDDGKDDEGDDDEREDEEDDGDDGR